jgi:hypothetical protein
MSSNKAYAAFRTGITVETLNLLELFPAVQNT